MIQNEAEAQVGGTSGDLKPGKDLNFHLISHRNPLKGLKK